MLTDGQRERITRLFRLYDTDGDGELTRDDYVEAVRRFAVHSGKQPDDPAVRKMRELLPERCWEYNVQADSDGDGRITLQEFLAQHDNLLSGPSGRQELKARAHALLAAVDQDEDGRVGPKEYAAIFSAWGIPSQSSQRSFVQLDSDGDGYLSSGEFTRHCVDFFYNDRPGTPSAVFFPIK